MKNCVSFLQFLSRLTVIILYGAYKYHGFRIRVHYLQKNSDDFNFGQIKY